MVLWTEQIWRTEIVKTAMLFHWQDTTEKTDIGDTIINYLLNG